MATELDVLQVITSTTRRGAERFAVELEQALSERGLRVATVALTAGTEPTLDGVEVLGPSRLGPTTLLALRRAAQTASLVVAHGSTTLPASAIATLATGTPFVYRNIGDPRYWSTSWPRRIRSRLLLGRAAAVVALTEETARRLVELYRLPPERIVAIPRAVRAEAFPLRSDDDRQRAREQLGVGPDERLALCVGALSPEKDVSGAVAAIGACPERWRLLIVGDGPDRATVAAAAAEIGSDRVQLLGQLADPVPVMTAADVLLLPSLTEGLPGVVIEAALIGVPAVATAVGFVDEIISEGVTGRIVAQGDPGALAAALLDSEAELATMGRAAHDQVVDRFSLDAAADRWQELLDRLSGRLVTR